ncbi:MAG: hypothetical protein ACREAC_02900, partial [Blastocatellia bacterium]
AKSFIRGTLQPLKYQELASKLTHPFGEIPSSQSDVSFQSAVIFWFFALSIITVSANKYFV